jgi:hypothetical protein
MEEEARGRVRLTDEQTAEIVRRLAEPHPKFLTLEEVRERFGGKRASVAR